MKKIVLMICLFAMAWQVYAGNGDQDFNYVPSIHGVIRSRWECETTSPVYNRFEVRNARVAIAGNVCQPVSYMVQADFCDQGTFKILDAFGMIRITRDLAFRAGQFLMPVSIEALRAPADYIFANRSFIGKQICNVRGVGAELSYTMPGIPLTLKAAAFNTTGISDHNRWNRTVAASGSVRYVIGNMAICAGIQSTRPQSIRMNILDGSVSWICRRWYIEGEYMLKMYSHDSYRSCNAWSAFADYRIPVNAGIFNRLSLQARFDGMTDHSNGHTGAVGTLVTDDPRRNRITVGSTISHIHKKLHADLRLNYEKYLYQRNTTVPVGQNDRIVTELIVKF